MTLSITIFTLKYSVFFSVSHSLVIQSPFCSALKSAPGKKAKNTRRLRKDSASLLTFVDYTPEDEQRVRRVFISVDRLSR